jgi:hypothetical protein
MASLKPTISSKLTGRTQTIQGIEAEEREFLMSVDGPAMANIPAGPAMNLLMEVWTAKSSETMRVPLVRELAGYNLWAARR